MKQTTFVLLAFDRKKKQTLRERFRSAMEAVVPRAALLAVTEPHCSKAGRQGRPPMLLATMLRIYFRQHWYALSDPSMEDTLYEIRCAALPVLTRPTTQYRTDQSLSGEARLVS